MRTSKVSYKDLSSNASVCGRVSSRKVYTKHKGASCSTKSLPKVFRVGDSPASGLVKQGRLLTFRSGLECVALWGQEFGTYNWWFCKTFSGMVPSLQGL
eukprot:5224535-Amphidinium_carterae.1